MPSTLPHRLLALTLAALCACGDSDLDLTTDEAGLAANQPPHAYAAYVSPVTLPASARLDGSRSTDSDGRLVAFRWSQGSGPNTATFADATAMNPTVSGLAAGTYRFFLTVTDDRGATDTDWTDLLVLPGSGTTTPPANVAPSANAGSDQTITLPLSAVSLSGSGSDSDGSISRFAWTRKSGGAARIVSPAAAATQVDGLVAGAYVFTLTVTDDRGAQASDDVQVTVLAAPTMMPTGTRVCAQANEWAPYPTPGALSLACPTGQLIQSVVFASYGTPTGSCGSFATSSCHAPASLVTLQSSCVGRASCTVTNFNALFGDPCSGTQKRLYAEVACGAGTTTMPVVDAGTSPTTPAIDAGSSPNTNPISPVSFSAIPISDPDLIAPGRGLEVWHGTSGGIAYPSEGSGVQSADHYVRFTWNQLETARDVYSWTRFDAELHAAIDSGRKFAFGVMTLCPGCDPGYNGMLNYAGADSAYPQYLHSDMQAESVKDWISSSAGSWIPNWNSTAYLTRFEKLLQKINEHLETTTYAGVPYKYAINYIDVRGYGAWGEWHNGSVVDNLADPSQQPQAARATATSLTRIIDAHVNAFPNHQLVAMISTFDANRLQNTLNPPAVAYHALQTQNARGKLGWRRDNWGCLDNRCGDYIRYYSDLHPDAALRTLIMERYKYAPVNGEPMNGGSVVGDGSGSTCYYWDLKTQVERYHASSFGNGNFQGVTGAQCARDNVRAAAKVSGYRLVVSGGLVTANVGASRRLTVQLGWRNVGLTPTYEDWNVNVELRNAAGTTVWTGKSTMQLRLFLPSSTALNVTDDFVLPAGVASGTYSVRLVVKDPNGVRKPLPLAVLGRAADGSYALGTVVVP